MPRPTIELWLELETRCNLHCQFCYNYWRGTGVPAPRKLPSEQLIEGIQKLLDSTDCRIVSLSGGEPLLSPIFEDVLRLIASYRIPIVLTTNGTLLTQERCAELVLGGVNTFQIPLHSTSSEMHDFLSGMKCFGETIAAFVYALATGAFVAPVFVATKRNLSHLAGVLEFARLVKIDTVIINRFVPGGLGLLNVDNLGLPTEEEIISTLLAVDGAARNAGIALQLGVPVDIPKPTRDTLSSIKTASCAVAAGQQKWTLDVAGNLRRCSHSKDTLGNISSGGIELLLAELQHSGARNNEGYHSCTFLPRFNLVRIPGAD